MNDLKSKLPDLKEVASMANKLYKNLKKTVEEIIQDYKKKRTPSETKEEKKDKSDKKN